MVYTQSITVRGYGGRGDATVTYFINYSAEMGGRGDAYVTYFINYSAGIWGGGGMLL